MDGNDLPDGYGVRLDDPDEGRTGFVPNDIRNRDWREYQDWIADGYSAQSE